MDNPYQRLRKLTTTSQRDFAEKYSLSKTTMNHIESGQYPDLSEYQIECLGKECFEKNVDAKDVLNHEYSAADLQSAYHGWQAGERMQVAYIFRNTSPQPGTAQVSPFEQFIVDVAGTVQGFCKKLKVPAASTTRYLRGETKTMPKVIRLALNEVQYPYMVELVGLQDEWINQK